MLCLRIYSEKGHEFEKQSRAWERLDGEARGKSCDYILSEKWHIFKSMDPTKNRRLS